MLTSLSVSYSADIFNIFAFNLPFFFTNCKNCGILGKMMRKGGVRMLRVSNVMAKAISIAIGLIFLVVGLIFFLKYDPAAFDTEGTGTIVEINERYEYVGDDAQLVHDVYIDYSVGDETFEHVEFFEYNNGMKVGDTVKFFYMSEDPSQIAGSDKDKAPYFGLAFAVVGLGMLVVTVVKIIRRKPM